MRTYADVSLRLAPELPEKLVAQIEEFYGRIDLESRLGEAATWTSRAT